MLGLGGDIGMGLLAGGNRPSYFELFMQGAISDMLRPAMQHVVAALAPRFPVLYRSQRWHDEIFLALLGALEWAHLRTQEASFAESFFGLKRVRYFPPSARGEDDSFFGRHGEIFSARNIWGTGGLYMCFVVWVIPLDILMFGRWGATSSDVRDFLQILGTAMV